MNPCPRSVRGRLQISRQTRRETHTLRIRRPSERPAQPLAVARGMLHRGMALCLERQMYRSGDLKRWLYDGGRPHRIAAFLNRGWATAASAGLFPNWMATLEVRGRKTGRLLSFPLVVANHGGERYLVPMLGQSVNWVANVRAANMKAVLRHGRREEIQLEEVEVGARAPILKSYLEAAPGARPHVPVDRRAPLAEFEKIAAQYPVFRIRPSTTN